VVVIGPGGIKGFAALGFLLPLEEENVLSLTDTYCGVSVGAIISLLLIVGYSVREIIGHAIDFNIFKSLEDFSIAAILRNKGLLSNESIKSKLVALIVEKLGSVPTLYGLYLQTGKSLVTSTLNVTDKESVIMSYATHANVSCIDAVMFSINIPLVFYQLHYNNKTLVDGALGNPYPTDYFDDGNTDILGIHMDTPTDMDTNVEITEATLYKYLYNLIHAIIDQRRISIIRQSSTRCRHVCLKVNHNAFLGGIDLSDKSNMLLCGFNHGKRFCSTPYVPLIVPSYGKYIYPPYYMRDDDTTST